MENQTEKQTTEADKKIEKSKHLALWSGMIFFFVLIGCLWAVNTRDIFYGWKAMFKREFNIERFSQEFNKSLKKDNGRIDKFQAVPSFSE